MNPFEMLGDEELYQMCQGWPTDTLMNMAQAYDRVQVVCEKVITLRQEIQDVRTALDVREIVFYIRNFTNQKPDDIQSQISLLRKTQTSYVEGQTVLIPYLDIQQLIKFLKHGKGKEQVKEVVSSIVPELPLKMIGTESGLSPDIFGDYDFRFIREYHSDYNNLEQVIKMLHQQDYTYRGTYGQ